MRRIVPEENSTGFKEQKRWDSYAEKWFEDFKNHPSKYVININSVSNSQIKDIVNELGEIKRKRVLELGCGRGDLSIITSKLGAEVTGVDIGDNLIKLANLIAELNGAKCDFVVGNIESLPFPNDQFDFITGRKLLHHLNEEGIVKALREAYRVLKLNVKAVFIEPIENSRFFDFLQNLFLVGSKDLGNYRPSILNIREWKEYLKTRDDRALSNKELLDSGKVFERVEFIMSILNKLDCVLTSAHSTFRVLSQSVMVVYIKEPRVNV